MTNGWIPPPLYRFKRIHSYAASFSEELAHDLVHAETRSGDTVLDPFTGASTTIAQARILGRSVVGIDVDPIACLIGRVVTTPYEVDALDTLEHRILQNLERCENDLSVHPFRETEWQSGAIHSVNGLTVTVPREEKLSFWFAARQRAVLAVAMGLVCQTDDHYQDIVRLAVSSSIIHKWPNTVSLARDIDHSRPHRTERNDLTLSAQFTIFRKAFLNVVRILRRLNAHGVPEGYYSRVIQDDAEHALACLEEKCVDYVLTSPPYFDAIDYPRAHQMARWWLWPDSQHLARSSYIGLRSAGRDPEVVARATSLLGHSLASAITGIGNRSPNQFCRFCRYVVDLDSVFRQIHRVLRAGGVATLIMGNNTIRGVQLPVVDTVVELLTRNSFHHVRAGARELALSRRRYPYGLKGFKGLMSVEYVIRAMKPERNH